MSPKPIPVEGRAGSAETFASVGGETADWIEYDGYYRPDDTKFFPSDLSREREYDLGEINRWVLDGWLPGAPIITREKMITAFGSCFAYNVEAYLRERGFKTSIGQYGEDKTN